MFIFILAYLLFSFAYISQCFVTRLCLCKFMLSKAQLNRGSFHPLSIITAILFSFTLFRIFFHITYILYN